ncbi:MAG: AbrB/MazE/SpoVT family DNA-binding domain-containing protein [Parvibaculaceae bacterium]
MRITSKSQVTIPKHIRDVLDVGPGGEVDFVNENGVVRLVALKGEGANGTMGRRLVHHLRSFKRKEAMTSDAIMALTRGEDL